MTIPVNLPDQPEIEDLDQLVEHWSEEISITMSRSEWQFIQIRLLIDGNDRRRNEDKARRLRRMSNRIRKLID